MKLQYFKILLFFILLNILVSLYHAHNTNKPYITPHNTQTNRSLCECDTQSSNYDKDTGIKSVMQQFVDRTSQRFEEYEERMKDKRQKRKEERDKNIQKIIEKDKMEKSLSEKVEKGCLMCGCALGGGVLPVWGLVSGLWYATWLQYLSGKALPAGIYEGIKEGLNQIKLIANIYRGIEDFPGITVEQILSSGKFTNSVHLFDMVEHINTMGDKFKESIYDRFWGYVSGIAQDESITAFNTKNSTSLAAVAKAVEEGKAHKVAEFAANTSLLSNTIIASVVTIIIIVLIMVIIYLVLRYRRKKKMKKKAQYTKLLNQ
ncbi:rifin [Plasmodium reichenowi]|uniref:Rifin n=1 Tax=Plasmodium reichenowi TaxID=5854 RepID=A0A060RQA0_PLARE|nr:rifin [Plasmodium reichenowi]